jgi:hypothetical protein
MKSVRLIFGTYNHQPEGNLPELFERGYQSAYKPFLSLLYDHPRIPVVLYYCGSLFEWLEEQHPEFLMLLREMVQRNQVELLGGGFYSPILSLIPDGDKLGQIEKLSTYLRGNFGVRPRGGWLIERVWEPALARILRNSGLEYTFLDDRHFHTAGIDADSCLGSFITEDQGKTLNLLPIRSELAERLPFLPAAELVQSLRLLAAEQGERVVVLLVEGERLGDRQGTYQICFREKWLASFLELLEDNREWLHPVVPRADEHILRPRGRVYLPCLSCADVMRWALDGERQRGFAEAAKRLRRPETEAYLVGGYFRQFLTRFPEVNLLYSRLLYTHLLVNQMRGDKSRKKAALEELWRGQQGAAYWHGTGPGGGIFDPRLRQASYRAFIEADKISRGGQSFLPSLQALDFDMDGKPEYLYRGKTMNALVHQQGGALLALEFLPSPWNYLATMARWAQAYHRYKVEGCDAHMRMGFLDHFLAPETQIDAFDRMSYTEQGDFLNQPYNLVNLRREHKELELMRQGRLRIRRRDHPFTVGKRYRFRDGTLELGVELQNQSAVELELWYGLELNLALPSKEGKEVRILSIRGSQKKELGSERAEAEKLDGLLVRDLRNSVAITLSSEQVFSLWSLPVETVAYPPQGRTRQYQGGCLLLSWKLTLEPGQSWAAKIGLQLQKE